MSSSVKSAGVASTGVASASAGSRPTIKQPFAFASRWSQIPREILVHIFGFLDAKHRLTCGQVCRYWRDIFNSDAFGGVLYFQNDNSRFHRYLIKRHGGSARRLAFLDLKSQDTNQMLNDCSSICDQDVLRSFTLLGDEIKGAFRHIKTEERTTSTEAFLLPILCSFLRGKTLPREALHDQFANFDYFQRLQDDRKVKGFSFEHLALINLRLTATDDYYYEGDNSVWSFVAKYSGQTLKFLDLIYLTDRMYLPKQIFSFHALEQLCISTNHLKSRQLEKFAGLRNLNHLIVYVGQRPQRSESFSLDEETWKQFHQKKKQARISFILKSVTDVNDNVPRNVPIFGLEMTTIDGNFKGKSGQAFKEVVLLVENLCIVHVDLKQPNDFLDFLDEALKPGKGRPGAGSSHAKPLHSGQNGAHGASSSTSVGSSASSSSSSSILTPKLHKLRKFQYGGIHDAPFYLRLAERIGNMPDLQQWIISYDNVTFDGAHTVMSHGEIGSKSLHQSRQKVAKCTAPPDDINPIICSASDRKYFHRKLMSHLGSRSQSMLRLLTKKALLGSSIFWKADPCVLRRLRDKNNSAYRGPGSQIYMQSDDDD